MAAKGGLGIGLSALFDDNTTDSAASQTLRLSEIEPNRSQPRKKFDDESISALADSIKRHGILQPLLVRPYGSGYQIVAGERRWRAARMLGMTEVPVQIREFSDSESMQIALIENLQRENLNPIEEAQGYFELMESYGMTQDEISKTVGRSRSAVAFDDEGLMTEAAEKACGGRLTVRELEKMAQNRDKSDKNKTNERIDSYFKEMEIGLHEALGRKVKVEYGKNKGALILEFYDRDDLSELAKRLTKE